LSRSLPGASRTLVLVADETCSLFDSIRRMRLGDVRRVGDLVAARVLCNDARIAACIVVLPPSVPDERPSWPIESDAPGRGRIPALLVAPAVTPHIRKAARSAGYAGVIGPGLPPRMLYRLMRGLLQASRRAGLVPAGRRGRGISAAMRACGGEAFGPGKSRLQ